MDQITFPLSWRACRATDSKRWRYDDPDGELPIPNRCDFNLKRLVERLN